MENRGLDVTSQSRYIRSPAFPPGTGADYVNAVVRVETAVSPERVLSVLHEIEADFGRVRGARWSDRMLDLDLLSMGNKVLPSVEEFSVWAGLPLNEQRTRWPDRLILPHPRIQDRAFVLVPLAEIAPEWTHPVSGRTAVGMLEALDPADVASVIPL